MRKNILLLVLFFSTVSYGQIQYALIDKKIAQIPESATNSTTTIAKYIVSNFNTEEEKIRAVYYWTASNISYDIENMFAVTSNETDQDRIIKTLKTKKGICEDYAMVFNEIAKLVGVKSIVIHGYTKQNGKVDILSHAWCSAKMDNKWYLFDPTWGSGYVNNNRYIRKINNSYFRVTPAQMINSHMPFDYLWQFINYPINNQEFIDGKTQINKAKKYFDYYSEIAKYESMTKIDQFFESAQRIEKTGIKNQLISQAYAYAKMSWNNERENENTTRYNEIVNQYNEAIHELNDFIYFRNNKFKPNLPDDEIKAKIQIPNDKFKKCQEALFNLSSLTSANAGNSSILKKSVADAVVQSENHLEFVNNYLSKGKLVRKTMFSKVSWFGIPLN